MSQPQPHIIYNVGSSSPKVLDLSNSNTTTILGWTPNGGANQQWYLYSIGPNIYHIQNKQSGRFINVDETDTIPVGSEDAFPWTFTFYTDANNVTSFEISSNGFAMDLPVSGGNVQLVAINGSPTQRWVVSADEPPVLPDEEQ